MLLKNKWYDVLKWLDLLVIPASAALYAGLAKIWGWPYAEAVSQTAVAVETFIGAIIGISSANYQNGDEII